MYKNSNHLLYSIKRRRAVPLNYGDSAFNYIAQLLKVTVTGIEMMHKNSIHLTVAARG